MYNNFSSKKTKKVISALLASALVVTSGPITADAATAKVVGIKKSITVSASATNKVTGLSKAEKKIVKVTKKGKKFTIKGLKAGKATFKIGKKSYTVKVGATTVKAAKTKLTLTKGKKATLKFTTKSGNGDTLTFKASNKNVTLAKTSAKIAKSAASVKATAKKAGKTTITATSKATGKKATVTVTVKNAAKPATTTPGASNTPVATATGSATNTPEATATATATATASGSATNTPDVTATPVATATATPVATGSATNTPEATEVPTEAPTKAPEVVTGGTITVSGVAVSGASVKVISGSVVIATGAEAKTFVSDRLAAGTYTIEVSKDGYETFTKEVTITDGKDVTIDVQLNKIIALAVESVKAVNISQVEVKFNKTVNKTAAETVGNYELKDTTLASVQIDNAELLEDGQTVLLTIGNGSAPISFDTAKKYTVSVKKDIQTSDAAAFETALKSAEFDVTDAVLPAVASVKAYGNKKIVVTFNKPVKLSATTDDNFALKQNNAAAGGTLTHAYVAGTGYTQVTINTTDILAAGTYSLSVFGDTSKVCDAQGLKLADTVKSVEVVEATSVAQVKEVKVNGRNSVDVVFDSAVKEPTANTISWGVGKTADEAKLLSDNCTVRYKFTTNIIAVGEQTFTIENVEDAYGNTVPKKAVKANVVAENIATALVTVVNDKKIEVSFSKAMLETGTTGASANNPANYVIKNAKGETVSITSVKYNGVDATKTYKTTLTFSTALEAGNYTISVSGIKDLVDTEMTEIKDQTITVVDTTRPELVGNISASGATNKFVVYYAEAMATSGVHSIANADNYMIDFDGTAGEDPETLPSGTTLVAAADGKSVVITLPSTYSGDITNTSKKKLKFGKTAGTDSTIYIGRDDNGTLYTVADAAGNIQNTLPSSSNANSAVIDAEQIPTIASQDIQITGANTLKVAVGTGKLSTVVATDFEYTLDGEKTWTTAAAASITTDASGNQYVEITTASDMDASTDIANVFVRTKNPTTGNLASAAAFETPLAKSAKSNAASSTTFAASIKSIQTIDETHIRLQLNGLVGATPADLAAMLQVYQDNTLVAEKATDISIAKINNSDSDLMITLTNLKKVNLTKDVTIKTLPQALITAKDKNHKFYTANETGVTAKAMSSFTLDATTPFVWNGALGAIVIKYNTILDTTTVKSGWDGSAKNDVVANVDTDGNLTLDGYAIGTISGVKAVKDDKVVAAKITGCTLAYDAVAGTLTLTIGHLAASTDYSVGTMKYAPVATMKNTAGVAIDTSYKAELAATAPESTITSATYVKATRKLTITGTNFEKTGSIDVTKIKIKGNALSTSDVESVTIKDATTVEIILTSAKATELTGADAGLDATGDVLTADANYSKDLFGNAGGTAVAEAVTVTVREE